MARPLDAHHHPRSADAYQGQIFFTGTNTAAIADPDGTPVWFLAGSDSYTNLQMQTYQGSNVLTWWQGTGGPGAGGTGVGTDMLTTVDHSPLATIGADGSYAPDTHEFRITPSNTALITSYVVIPYDLSAVGGPADGQLRNAYCEEVDIATGKVLLRWSAADHVPLTDSYVSVPANTTSPYDFFHINSISLTPDDQLLLSSRHTCALYKVDRTSGKVLWTLGGKSSSFAVDSDAVFGFQHHAVYEEDGRIRLFDDGSDGTTTWHPSRVAWIAADEQKMTASLADSMTIAGIQSTSQGSAQRLPNGNVFVSWGSVPRLSEFTSAGKVVFDAILSSASYRAFKFQIS
ncbi:arylsulfotransferase family protein [Streptomyces sp. NPDC048342]|uniref:arylsulfotransferase family protein n=1 Tax=unclassified Streptomyces TaxID=2593676 RepID=UPI003416C295